MEYNNMGNDPNRDYNNERPIFVEKKKSGCLADVLKVGCGFILGIICTIMFSGFFYFASAPKVEDIQREDEMPSLYGDSKGEIQYFKVRSNKGKATIHTGMPKDSVILLLGEPTEFMTSDFIDEITYRYGNYDLNSLHIEFRKGKVKSVSQH